MKNVFAALVLGALAATASAQTCSTLAVTGTGAPGTNLTFTLTGQPVGSFGILFIGDTTGSTSLPFGTLATLELGLAQPFIPVPLMTRPTGTSLTVRVPNQVSPMSLFAQGTGVSFDMSGMSFSLAFCTSNVVPFSVGTPN